MDDGMEHSNIVEFYPTLFFNRPDWMVEMDECSVRIGGSHFTRTVYRPLIGPDVLIAQRDLGFLYFEERMIPVPSSSLAFYNDLMGFLSDITYPRLEEARRLNPDWKSENLADCISRYAESQGFCLQGRPPESFFLSACEAFGDLCIMSESAGWNGIVPAPPTDIRVCTLCNLGMTHGNSIALHCRHVFHRDCFFPVVWENQRVASDSNCPECASVLHLLSDGFAGI